MLLRYTRSGGTLLTAREPASYLGANIGSFSVLTLSMDPVIAAQVRLEQAVSRLEEALAARGVDGQTSQNIKLAAVSAELERLRSENATLEAARRKVSERLDMAIKQIKGLIES